VLYFIAFSILGVSRYFWLLHPARTSFSSSQVRGTSDSRIAAASSATLEADCARGHRSPAAIADPMFGSSGYIVSRPDQKSAAVAPARSALRDLPRGGRVAGNLYPEEAVVGHWR